MAGMVASRGRIDVRKMKRLRARIVGKHGPLNRSNDSLTLSVADQWTQSADQTSGTKTFRGISKFTLKSEQQSGLRAVTPMRSGAKKLPDYFYFLERGEQGGRV